MKYNSTALHSSTAKERCKPRGRIDRNKGKVGNRIKSIVGKPADQPRIRLLVACLPQRQVVYAGSGVRVSHTDAVLPFASLIWPNQFRTTASSRRRGGNTACRLALETRPIEYHVSPLVSSRGRISVQRTIFPSRDLWVGRLSVALNH